MSFEFNLPLQTLRESFVLATSRYLDERRRHPGSVSRFRHEATVIHLGIVFSRKRREMLCGRSRRTEGQRAPAFSSNLFQKGCDCEAALRIALPSRSALESAMPRRGHSTNRCSVPDGGSGHSQ